MKRPRSLIVLYAVFGSCVLLMLVTTTKHIFTGTTVILNRGDVLTVPLMVVGGEGEQVIKNATSRSSRSALSSSSATTAEDEVTIVSEVRVTRHLRLKEGAATTTATNESSIPASDEIRAITDTTSEQKNVENVGEMEEVAFSPDNNNDEDASPSEQERLSDEDDLSINLPVGELKSTITAGEPEILQVGEESSKTEGENASSSSRKVEESDVSDIGSDERPSDTTTTTTSSHDDENMDTPSSSSSSSSSSNQQTKSGSSKLDDDNDDSNVTTTRATGHPLLLNASDEQSNIHLTLANYTSSANSTTPLAQNATEDDAQQRNISITQLSSDTNSTDSARKSSSTDGNVGTPTTTSVNNVTNVVNATLPTNATNDGTLNSTIVTESNATTTNYELKGNITILSPTNATRSTTSNHSSSLNSTSSSDLVNSTDTEINSSSTTNLTNAFLTKFHKGADDEIAVFYNAFLGGVGRHRRRAEALIRIQMGAVNQSDHLIGRVHVYYSYISRKIDVNLTICDYFPEDKCTEMLRIKKGDEIDTLQNLWSYCHQVPEDSIVMYMHDKGAYHWTSENHWLRAMHMNSLVNFDTCTKGLETTECNVCSARFSPMPHYHTSGNMWTAQCGYVKRLVEPKLFAGRMQELADLHVWKNDDTLKEWFPQCFDPVVLAIPHDDKEPCPREWSVGLGRFASEHWVHSHPTVIPCDSVPEHIGENGTTFKWAYENLPANSRWRPELHVGPRLSLDEFKNPGSIPNILQPLTKWNQLHGRILEWEFLYDELPPYDSWIWPYYKNGEKLRETMLNKEKSLAKEKA